MLLEVESTFATDTPFDIRHINARRICASEERNKQIVELVRKFFPGERRD